jgi:peptidoglycan-N-acetylglucosamine deacetylase
MKVMDTFDERNTSLTIGIIGNYFGNDTRMVDFVKNKIEKQGFEIANHGWNHENFTLFDKREQGYLMHKTNAKLYNIFDTSPQVFIAPYNAVNNDTFLAAQENGIIYISAGTTFDRPPYDIKGKSTPYHLPQTTTTGDVSANETSWIGYNYTKVFSEIRASINEYGFAVVTMHPQEYALRDKLNYQNKVNDLQIKELQLLLDSIQKNGIRIVKISDIPSTTIDQTTTTTKKEVPVAPL